MAAITAKPCCVSCSKEITVLKCESCWQTTLNQSMVQTEEASVQQPQRRHALIQVVDDWECNSNNRIRQTANEARRLISAHTTERVSQVEVKLSKLTNQLRQCHQENDFLSKNVSRWQEELIRLSRQLEAPSSITVREVSAPLLTKIHVDLPAFISVPKINANAKWIQNGVTVAGGKGYGNGLNQLNYPRDLHIDDDQTIYIADASNHRIVEWKSGATSGQVVAGGNGQGHQANQLNDPRAVIVDKEGDSLIICDYSNKRVVRWSRQNGTNGETIISDISCWGLTMDSYGYLYVADYDKHEVKRWKMGETNGTVVAGGNGAGNRLDQLCNATYIFVDQDHSVYVSEEYNHRVTKWIEGANEGIIVAGGQGAGNALTQLNRPFGIVVDQLGTVYVADRDNNRVTRWLKGATQGSLIAGGNGGGAQPNQFSDCRDMSFDRQANLYVCDRDNHRVQKFSIDPTSNT